MKNKLTIVKVGGFIFEDEYILESFLSNFSKISGNKILVHGGGKIASNFSKKLGIVPIMLEGRRVTDKETLDVVIMTYAGLLNKKLVSKLQKLSCNAIGLSGADANLIQAKKRNIENVNYGYVGDITHVEKNILQKMISSDLCPVICSLTHDGNGQILNTLKLIKYLTSTKAQQTYVDNTYEYSVLPSIDPNEIVKNWGNFKKDTLDLNMLGSKRNEAVRIFDKSGWK